jgi:hypothetical protein
MPVDLRNRVVSLDPYAIDQFVVPTLINRETTVRVCVLVYVFVFAPVCLWFELGINSIRI